MGFFDNIDKGLGKVEKAGFNTANRIHRFAVNCILLFIGYNIYTIFRDYNLHFREKRGYEPPQLNEYEKPEIVEMDFTKSTNFKGRGQAPKVVLDGNQENKL